MPFRGLGGFRCSPIPNQGEKARVSTLGMAADFQWRVSFLLLFGGVQNHFQRNDLFVLVFCLSGRRCFPGEFSDRLVSLFSIVFVEAFLGVRKSSFTSPCPLLY